MFFALWSTVVALVFIVSFPSALTDSIPETPVLKNQASWSVQSWPDRLYSYSVDDHAYTDTNNNSIREAEESPLSLLRRRTSYDSEVR